MRVQVIALTIAFAGAARLGWRPHVDRACTPCALHDERARSTCAEFCRAPMPGHSCHEVAIDVAADPHECDQFVDPNGDGDGDVVAGSLIYDDAMVHRVSCCCLSPVSGF
ncbi:hypothetical protein ACNOYE_23995 [Nannocystaceae bacterium ST9]